MKMAELSLVLPGLLKNPSRRPIMIYGPPGIGKSALIKYIVVNVLGWKLIDERVSQWAAVDARGVPFITDKKRTRWCPPEFLPNPDSEEYIVIFLDELTQATKSVQAALLQLMLDRQLGDYILPKNVIIIAAGNDITHRSGSNNLIAPLSSRMIQLFAELDPNQWLIWALNNKLNMYVRSFIQSDTKNHLYDFNEKDISQKVFACPRTWHMVSEILDGELKDYLKDSRQRKILEEVIAGCVGIGKANKLVAHFDLFHTLPKISDIVKDPLGIKIPQDASMLSALGVSIHSHIENNEKDINPLMKFVNRSDYQNEFKTLLLIDCVASYAEKMIINPDIKDWMMKNQTLLDDILPKAA